MEHPATTGVGRFNLLLPKFLLEFFYNRWEPQVPTYGPPGGGAPWGGQAAYPAPPPNAYQPGYKPQY